MKRKLIQLSPSTSVVSLPKQWINKNKLKKGIELNLEEADNKIIISTNSSKTNKEVELNISNLSNDLIWAYVDAAYIAGYDSITLITKNQNQSNLMTTVVRYFPGLIIFEQRKNKVQFKDITNDSQEDIDKILARIFNMNIDMISDSLDAIKNNEWELLSKIKKRDYTINSYISYCLRQLNKFNYIQFSKTGLMNTYIKLIEMFSDKLAALFVFIGNNKIKIDNKIILKILDIYNLIRKTHFNYSQNLLSELDSLRLDFSKLINSQDNELKLYLDEISNILFDIEELEMQLHV